MIVEHVILPVVAADRRAFVTAFAQARLFIEASPGFHGLDLLPAAEPDGGFLLLVRWDSIAAHRDGFRQSDRYPAWRALLHPFYPSVPVVTYFESVT